MKNKKLVALMLLLGVSVSLVASRITISDWLPSEVGRYWRYMCQTTEFDNIPFCRGIVLISTKQYNSSRNRYEQLFSHVYITPDGEPILPVEIGRFSFYSGDDGYNTVYLVFETENLIDMFRILADSIPSSGQFSDCFTSSFTTFTWEGSSRTAIKTVVDVMNTYGWKSTAWVIKGVGMVKFVHQTETQTRTMLLVETGITELEN